MLTFSKGSSKWKEKQSFFMIMTPNLEWSLNRMLHEDQEGKFPLQFDSILHSIT